MHVAAHDGVQTPCTLLAELVGRQGSSEAGGSAKPDRVCFSIAHLAAAHRRCHWWQPPQTRCQSCWSTTPWARRCALLYPAATLGAGEMVLPFHGRLAAPAAVPTNRGCSLQVHNADRLPSPAHPVHVHGLVVLILPWYRRPHPDDHAHVALLLQGRHGCGRLRARSACSGTLVPPAPRLARPRSVLVQPIVHRSYRHFAVQSVGQLLARDGLTSEEIKSCCVIYIRTLISREKDITSRLRTAPQHSSTKPRSLQNGRRGQRGQR